MSLDLVIYASDFLKKLRLVTAQDTTYQWRREIPTHNWCHTTPQAAAQGAHRCWHSPCQQAYQPARGMVWCQLKCLINRSFTETGFQPCQTACHLIQHAPYQPAVICAIDTQQLLEGSSRCVLKPEMSLVHASLQWITAAEVSLAQLQEQRGLLQWSSLFHPKHQQQGPAVPLIPSFCPVAQDSFGCCPKPKSSSVWPQGAISSAGAPWQDFIPL